MLRKWIVSMIALGIFASHSNAATNNNLRVVFDDLNYSLTVEWDQKDQDFYHQQMEKFIADLGELRKQGVSDQEILEQAMSTVKDGKIAEELRKTLSMIGVSSMSPEEAREFMASVMKKSYNEGASWSGTGGKVIYTVVGILAVFVLTAVAGLVTGLAKIEDGCYKFRTCHTSYTGWGTEVRTCEYNCWY